MANKARPTDELVTTWTTKLSAATKALLKKEADARAARDARDNVIRDALNAGLRGDDVGRVTGLTDNRIHQINRGVRT